MCDAAPQWELNGRQEAAGWEVEKEGSSQATEGLLGLVKVAGVGPDQFSSCLSDHISTVCLQQIHQFTMKYKQNITERKRYVIFLGSLLNFHWGPIFPPE